MITNISNIIYTLLVFAVAFGLRSDKRVSSSNKASTDRKRSAAFAHSRSGAAWSGAKPSIGNL